MVEACALSEAVVFLGHFKDMADPRQRAKVIYPLDEVLLPCLLAVPAGSETFVDIARFSETKLGLLRRLRSQHQSAYQGHPHGAGAKLKR
jgi:hypothetical protein